ncbi:FAR1 DNA binding domain [Macleaya cordata]|uniref:Protein FAR1-RELATED SEQUENCE n=1 Tax=Macleaya cordata TaxID=56857 RepID=A0A200Q2W7_MACCD|nr:FAR1 DNA binding domain [Macleaya cordata]
MEEASESKESVAIEDVELEPCAGLDEAEENYAARESTIEAMMQVKRNGNGKWVMIQFIEEHNHELHPQSMYRPPSVYVFRSQKLTIPKENITRTPRSSGTLVSKKMSTKTSGADENLDDAAKDCKKKADVEAYHRTLGLKTGSPYESQMSSIYTVDIFNKFQDEVLKILLCNIAHVQQEEGGNATYVVKELVMKSNGKRGIKEYTVLWNGLGTTISCICRLFEFKGYLCRHAMVVLFAVGMYEIPSHYILRRWTRDAKNIDLFDENCTGAQVWGPEYIEKCFIDLRTDSIKLAEEGSLSKERYKAVKIFLKEALIRVASMDKVPASYYACMSTILLNARVIGKADEEDQDRQLPVVVELGTTEAAEICGAGKRLKDGVRQVRSA